VRSGNAIGSRAEDRLDRASFADHVAAALRGAAADQGLVVALVGAWGSGKTSVLNMVKEQLAIAPSRTVLTFNPWMFSGREQLVGVFFEQVAGQLRLRGKREGALADQLISYGQALSPLVFVPVAGAWLGRISSIAAAAGQARSARKHPDPVENQRRSIEKALGELADPIVVVVDDLDRLSPAEIRDMLALVRLTAHFPKVIYLLAFDRAKVERALGEDGLDDGRSYLDKIVEVAWDMPAISQPALDQLLLEGLEQAIAGVTVGPFDAGRWPDLYYRVLRPLLNTPREVNRYLAPLPAMLGIIGEEVGLADVLTLEAIRVRLPDLFAQLGPMAGALTGAGMRNSLAPDSQAEVTAFTDSAGTWQGVAEDLCRLLFPATERYLGGATTYGSEWLPRWRRERRVASPEVLHIYLSKQLPAGALPAATMEQAVESLTDQPALQAIVDSLTADGLEDLLARLGAYEEDFPAEAARPASAVLLGLYPRLRPSQGFLDPGPELAVRSVVLRLLRKVYDEAERTGIIESLCAEVPSFTGRVRLLHLAGRLPNPSYERLIPATESDRLYRQVCGQIRHASPAQLGAERDLADLLEAALAEDPADREDIDLALDDDAVAEKLIRSATAQVRSAPFGSLAQNSEQILRWELLGTVVGDDAAIGDLVDRVAVRAVGDADLTGVIELAHRYLTGWRPAVPPFAGRQLVIRQPLSSPGTFMSPSVLGGWPRLLLRAVTSYEVDPAWATQADLSGRGFHDRLTALLDEVPLVGVTTALATMRGIPAQSSGWELDRDANQYSRAAIQRQLLGPEDEPAAIVRYSVLMPNNNGPMLLITDIALSPTEATDPLWTPLQPDQLCDLMTAALASTAGPIADEILRSVFWGEQPPRVAMELYLWSSQGDAGRRPQGTLGDMIALEALGAPVRQDRPAQQGMFAVAGDTPATTERDRRYLAVHALIRMALDWGYLDAPAALLPLAS
jgi:hypothetical protein